MRINSVKTLLNLIWNSVLQGIGVAVLIAFLLSFVYGYVYYYQQQCLHVQQLAELLASSASTVDGASLVAKQVSVLLTDEASIQNIVFYSTDHPIDNISQADIERTGADWYNALFADTVSFNRAVTSHYALDKTPVNSFNAQISSLNSSNTALDASASKEQSTATNALVGYINITLDVDKLRTQWLRKTILLWLLTLVLGVLIIAFIFRKLLRSSKDITELATTCELVINRPDLEQLPVIQQRFEFRELMQIKQSFIVLFERSRALQEQYKALGDLEQRLHQKDKSLETHRHNFQSMITHELKTSLNAISGGLQLLDSQHLSYDQQDILAIISKGSQHLELTLEQIIQLNKIEKNQVTVHLCEFSPLQLIADLLAKFESIAQKKGLALISHIHHIDYTLEGDANKIQQILTALLDNAIKFTHQGQITIESRLTHFNDSMRWQLKVIDTGIGIDNSNIDKIFMPFFQVDSSQTRQYEGAGIGLPIVKRMLQLLAATIEVRSSIGEGSQFSLTIALRNKYKSGQQSSLEGLTIIYCHADENDFLAKELERFGAAVTFQSIEQLSIAQVATAKFDMLMFAEDILPEKVAQLAQLVRDYETKHRTLLIYWYPMYRARERYKFEHELKIAGIDYYHGVPETPERLIEVLKKWTGRD